MTSARLTPAATTSTSTCPTRTSGSGTSARTRLSASPGWGIVMARMGPTLLRRVDCGYSPRLRRHRCQGMAMSGTGDPRGADAGGGGGRPVTSRDLPHLDFVEEVFLPVARSRAYVGVDTDAWLRTLARELRVEAERAVRPVPADLPPPVGQPYAGRSPGEGTAPSAPPTSTPAAAPRPTGQVPPTASTPVPVPVVPRPPVVVTQPVGGPVEPPPPSALQQWWDRTREAVGSDLAVHGL